MSWKHIYSGKVRELYENPELPEKILMVATDRVSAFDHILSPEIPGKGIELTAITNWWLDRIPVSNQTTDHEVPEEFQGRAVIAKKLKMFPVECVVRGYLAGSGFREYQQTGAISGVKLPKGLQLGDKLPEPIYTPAFKADQGESDYNISFEKTKELIGADHAEQIRELSLTIFKQASELALKAGIIIADTKFEFGLDGNTVTLADEVLTPDSSRYWDKQAWDEGEREQSFDKQIIRDWLDKNWDRKNSPPRLSSEVIKITSKKYSELRQRLESVG
ncbi:MAG: phosphoribosylaminoimidazolesuccinocarboxamide synthase [Microbacteriaceae bacterium]|nr:phosphoribosylaminoimidazolesuccinocarboxamide synthase [Microbacteriaceae bacterium]